MSRILLIDSDLECSGQLAHLLRAVGYDVDCAHGAAAGIDRLKNSVVDAVIVDVMLPELAGWQVLRWIRSQPDGAEVRVIAHSNESAVTRRLAKEFGADAFWVRFSGSFEEMCGSLEGLLGRAEKRAA